MSEQELNNAFNKNNIFGDYDSDEVVAALHSGKIDMNLYLEYQIRYRRMWDLKNMYSHLRYDMECCTNKIKQLSKELEEMEEKIIENIRENF